MDWRFLLTIILTVVFGTATIVLGIKLVKRKKPVWAHKTTKIIGLGADAPKELTLAFNGRPVGDVYETTFILFNKGTEAILYDDIAEKVAICFKSCDILREPIVKAKSGEAIKLSAKRTVRDSESCVELDFKYLDHNDGAVVEVLHTGSKKIVCLGNVIGAGQPKYIGDFTPSYPKRSMPSVIIYIGSVLLPIVWFLLFRLVPESGNPAVLSITTVLLPVFVGVFWASLAQEVKRFSRYRKFPNWSMSSRWSVHSAANLREQD